MHNDNERGTFMFYCSFVFGQTKRVFELLTVAAGSPAPRRHGRQKVPIPEYDLTDRRKTVDLLPVRSHLGIDTFGLP